MPRSWATNLIVVVFIAHRLALFVSIIRRSDRFGPPEFASRDVPERILD